MFDGKRDDGSAMTADYAQLRRRFEPVMEIMQKGGSSECYFEAGVSSDELCAFEQQPIDNLAGFNNPPRPDTGFARKALADGMALQRQLGVNPYQLGFIGSTDTHLGAAGAVAEEGYIGHGDAGVSAKDAVPPGLPDILSQQSRWTGRAVGAGKQPRRAVRGAAPARGLWHQRAAYRQSFFRWLGLFTRAVFRAGQDRAGLCGWCAHGRSTASR